MKRHQQGKFLHKHVLVNLILRAFITIYMRFTFFRLFVEANIADDYRQVSLFQGNIRGRQLCVFHKLTLQHKRA